MTQEHYFEKMHEMLAIWEELSAKMKEIQGILHKGWETDPVVLAKQDELYDLNCKARSLEAIVYPTDEKGEPMPTLFDDLEEKDPRKKNRYAPVDNRKKFVTTQRIKSEMGCDIKTLKAALRKAGIVSFYPYEGSKQKHIFKYQVPALKKTISHLMTTK